MKRFIQAFCILLFFPVLVKSQCLPLVFAAPDSACPYQQITMSSTSTNTGTAFWDFCPGELDSIPLLINQPPTSGTLQYPQAVKMVKENGKYYLFITKALTNDIMRYEYGTSLNNTPTSADQNFNATITGFITGIDMVKQNSKWYAFLCTFSGNKLLRMEFDSLNQANPTVTDLNVSGLLNPVNIKIIGNHLFVTNQSTAYISHYEFTNGFNNPPVMRDSINIGLANNMGIDIAYDCVSGKFIGFVSTPFYWIIYKLDFGSNLNNIPTVSNYLTAVQGSSGLNVVKDGNHWNLYIMCNTNTLVSFQALNSLDSAFTLKNSTNFPALNDPKMVTLINDNSEWNGFIPSNGTSSIYKLKFPSYCKSNLPAQDGTQVTNLSYPDTVSGYQSFTYQEYFSDGTSADYTDSIYIHIPPPQADFSNSAACLNSPVQFTDNSTMCYGNIVSYDWDFGDTGTSQISNPVHSYQSSGTFNVTLTIVSNSGASSTIQKTITVGTTPTADFQVQDTVCSGSSVLFTDLSVAGSASLASFEWSFGDNGTSAQQNPVYSYSGHGNYNVQLIVIGTDGCTDTTNQNINVLEIPTANFTVSNSCAGETTSFSNTSTFTGGSITSYQWDFGDSNTSTLVNPLHNYNSVPANYQVSLVAISSNGCNDTSVNIIRIGSKPIPSFTVSQDTACSGNIITFINTSLIASGDTISAYYWDFGDSTTDSVSVNPVHSFTNPGNYTVTLTAFSPTSCDSSVSRSVFVIQSPSANFSASDVCIGDSVSFIDLTVSPVGSFVNNWTWSFGDSDSSYVQNPVHLYDSAGTYFINLQVISSKGCIDTATSSVRIHALPIANFISGHACTNTLVQFTDSSYDSGDIVTNWTWDFGDGSGISNLINPQHIFTTPNIFPVSLTISNSFGCVNNIVSNIPVNQSPEFTISTTNNCLNVSNEFQYLPAAGSSVNVSYFWTFGDSAASFTPNPIHTYQSVGNYTTTLTVTDLSNACSLSQTTTVSIFPIPVAVIVPDSICINQSLTLSENSSVSPGSIQSWNWTLGTYGTSSQQNPVLSLPFPAVVPVKLVVTSDKGCKDSTIQNIEVNSLPLVSFTPNPYFGAPPANIQFVNLSDNGSYFWDFGDGTTSILFQPNHLYPTVGEFNVSLIGTNSSGCTDSTHGIVTILNPLNDISVEAVSFQRVAGWWELSTVIRNTGTLTAHNFNLNAQLDGKPLLNEAFNADSLLSGYARTFIFKSRFAAASDDNPQYLCISVDSLNNNKGDDKESNNERCISTSTTFSVVSVYPNPYTDFCYIALNIPEKGSVSINIYDALGRLTTNTLSLELEKGFNSIPLNDFNLAAGVYRIKIEYEDKTEVISLIKN